MRHRIANRSAKRLVELNMKFFPEAKKKDGTYESLHGGEVYQVRLPAIPTVGMDISVYMQQDKNAIQVQFTVTDVSIDFECGYDVSEGKPEYNYFIGLRTEEPFEELDNLSFHDTWRPPHMWEDE